MYKELKKILKKKEFELYGDIILNYSKIPELKADLNFLFGEHCINGEVLAFWFTGNLLAPQGKMINYVHMGYNSTNETDRIFEIRNGELISIKDYSNKEFFERYNNELPDSIRSLVYRTIKWDDLNISEEKDFSVLAVFFIDSLGKIDSISFHGSNLLIPTVKQILESVSYYKVYRHGRVYQRPKVIAFYFNEENKKKYWAEK